MPGVYITFPMDCPHFKPSVPSMQEDQIKEKTDAVTAGASEANEVGVMNITMSGKTHVVGWSLIFPLKDFRLPVNALHVGIKQKVNQLFGHVVQRQMLLPLTQLSTAPMAGRRYLKLTLESRYISLSLKREDSFLVTRHKVACCIFFAVLRCLTAVFFCSRGRSLSALSSRGHRRLQMHRGSRKLVGRRSHILLVGDKGETEVRGLLFYFHDERASEHHHSSFFPCKFVCRKNHAQNHSSLLRRVPSVP